MKKIQLLTIFLIKLKKKVVEKVLELRKEHKLGTWRIKWYLEKYNNINISESSAFRILKRNKVERLARKITRRAMHSIRYEKQTPVHHVQIDVKFFICYFY